MNILKITLEDKTITNLVGNRFGRFAFEKSGGRQLDFSGDILLIFPAEVDRVSPSFIQGFFNEILDHIELTKLEEVLVVESRVDDLKAQIIKDLL